MTPQNPAQDVSDSVIARLAWKHLSQKDARSLTFERSGGLVPQVSIDVPTVELTNFALALIEEANAARELQKTQVVGVPYGIIDPDYARIFTIARVLAWSEGYALTMHGSFTRDLDLVAVPWTDRAREPEHLARRVLETCGLKDTASNPGIKPHGRLVWTMRLPDFGDPRFVDFSILSTPQSSAPVVGERTGTVADISDDALLCRAVRSCAKKRRHVPAWSRISDLFALGSTYSAQLCRRFGVDPETGKSESALTGRGSDGRG